MQPPEPLHNYMREVIGNGPSIPLSVFGGVKFVGDFAQMVLDRRGPFQAQLCLCKPGAEIPDHAHPTVESITWYVTGQVFFRLEHDGKMVGLWNPADITETADGLCSHNGKFIRVPAGVKHGATIGPVGGAFISFQHWLDGEPTSVDADWRGPALSKEHAKELAR